MLKNTMLIILLLFSAPLSAADLELKNIFLSEDSLQYHLIMQFNGTPEYLSSEIMNPPSVTVQLPGAHWDKGDFDKKLSAENINQDEMESLAKKMSKGNFDLDDFAKQLKQMGKMGGMSGILSMLPGVSKAQKLMAENKISDKLINHQIAIINSMTRQERADPNLIKASRKIRISKGSGTRVQDVNKLLKQFLQSQKMMKRMKSMGKGGMPNDLMQKFQGNFPPKLN